MFLFCVFIFSLSFFHFLFIVYLVYDFIINIYILHAFITHTHSVMILNQRRWQSLGGQHGKGVDGLFEKVNFQMAFEGVESG